MGIRVVDYQQIALGSYLNIPSPESYLAAEQPSSDASPENPDSPVSTSSSEQSTLITSPDGDRHNSPGIHFSDISWDESLTKLISRPVSPFSSEEERSSFFELYGMLGHYQTKETYDRHHDIEDTITSDGLDDEAIRQVHNLIEILGD